MVEKDVYMVVRVTEPFCIQLCAGMVSRGCEAVTDISYEGDMEIKVTTRTMREFFPVGKSSRY